MVSSWPTVKFEDLYQQPSRNGLTKPKKVRGNGYKFINMGEIFAYDRMFSIPCDRVPLEDKEKATSLLKTGDLLFARQSLVLSGAGKIAIFLGDEEEVAFESHLIRVRLNKRLVNPDYVYYYFRSSYGRANIGTIVEQGAGQAGIRGSDLQRLEIPVPPLFIQNEIVNKIVSIDEKLELNQQTNQTFEQMAQALFKSWFVDFDPVIDNALAAGNPIPDELQERAELRQRVIAERATNPKLKPLPDDIQQLFPSEFEESELGWIPKGWAVCPMSEIVDIASSKRVFASDYVDEGVPFFRGKEITELSKGKKINTEIYISEDKYQELKEKAGVPKQGDILITSVGTIGNIYLVKADDKFYFKDGNLTWVRGYKKGFIPFYLKVWFESKHAKDEIERIKIGTTQQAITIKALNGIKLLCPNSTIAQLFEKQTASIFDKHDANIEQNDRLGKLRDTLLPKLISGQLKIPE
jgi:type I restriction enzyme S subunit